MIEITLSILIAISVYMILEESIRRKVFGVALLSTAINFVLLLSGRLQQTQPAFINKIPADKLSNPLPQALILTAIVIGFALLIFLCVMIKVLRKP